MVVGAAETIERNIHFMSMVASFTFSLVAFSLVALFLVTFFLVTFVLEEGAECYYMNVELTCGSPLQTMHWCVCLGQSAETGFVG
jgi:hypothetical protein